MLTKAFGNAAHSCSIGITLLYLESKQCFNKIENSLSLLPAFS